MKKIVQELRMKFNKETNIEMTQTEMGLESKA